MKSKLFRFVSWYVKVRSSTYLIRKIYKEELFEIELRKEQRILKNKEERENFLNFISLIIVFLKIYGEVNCQDFLFQLYNHKYLTECFKYVGIKNILVSKDLKIIFIIVLAAVETNQRGWITYSGYMAYWNMTTLINVSQTLEQLAYLGFAVGRSTPVDAYCNLY
uniref:EF_assoc_1 domain-containing protein n=1 Tax=Heterorhabditis bacteriophora TaxID=37862 RepID=A0A1I7WJ06_HETBA